MIQQPNELRLLEYREVFTQLSISRQVYTLERCTDQAFRLIDNQ